jgi:hypothetical protein
MVRVFNDMYSNKTQVRQRLMFFYSNSRYKVLFRLSLKHGHTEMIQIKLSTTVAIEKTFFIKRGCGWLNESKKTHSHPPIGVHVANTDVSTFIWYFEFQRY